MARMILRLLFTSVLVLCHKLALFGLLLSHWPLTEASTNTTDTTASETKNDLASEPRSVPELIEYWDYPGETHWIKTADNYILAVHRITGPAASIASAAATEALFKLTKMGHEASNPSRKVNIVIL